MNSLRLGVFNQWWVGEVRVALDLKDGGNDTGSLDDSFNLQQSTYISGEYSNQE